MLSLKEINHYKKIGISDAVMAECEKFLEKNQAELHNIADVGANEYRLMYKDRDGKLTSIIRPIPS